MPTKKYILPTCCLLAAMITAAPYGASAGGPMHLFNFFTGKKIDLKEHSCNECGGSHPADEYCITRHEVEECVVGKKKVYATKIKYEWVSVPETRYHWKNKLITEDVDCPYCMPVCKTEECERCVGRETWVKHEGECGDVHCRHIEPIMEKGETKHCEHEEGETTVRVKYWSCVKVPYTVYRQIKRPVCVKQPRYQKAKVKITRYVCSDCGNGGCNGGCDSRGYPMSTSVDDDSDPESNGDAGDSDRDPESSEELPAPEPNPSEAEVTVNSALPSPVYIGDSSYWADSNE